MSRIYAAFVLLVLLVVLLSPTLAASQPVVLYTDILSGPNSGGENNKGAYLSIFGSGFGSSQGSSKVYIGSTEVAAYKYWGSCQYGRSNIEQITVQPGPAVSGGAIKVEVEGRSSNTEHSFSVQPGEIYFVDNSVPPGSDGNGDGVIGDINSPFRYVQSTFYRSDYGPGDVIVMRGTGQAWNDEGRSGRFLMIYNKGGTAEARMHVMGYPGESVEVTGRSISWYKSPGFTTVSGLRVDLLEGPSTAFSLKDAEHNRIVNVEAVNMDGRAGGAGIIGGGAGYSKVLGVRIQNAGSKSPDDSTAKLYHGIYFESQAHDCEVAWSSIRDVHGGRGIQVYHNSGGRYNMIFHDNEIINTDRNPIVLGKGTQGGNKIYNNLIYQPTSGAPTIRTNSSETEVEIYNNTLIVTAGSAFLFGGQTSAIVKNNLIYATNSGFYVRQSDSYPDPVGSHNLWFGAGEAPSFDTSPLNADPEFVNPASGDFHLKKTSPAIDAGTEPGFPISRDHEGYARPFDGDRTGDAAYDIGAYEFPGINGGDILAPSEPLDLRLPGISP